MSFQSGVFVESVLDKLNGDDRCTNIYTFIFICYANIFSSLSTAVIFFMCYYGVNKIYRFVMMV
jgi:hypothetical protein